MNEYLEAVSDPVPEQTYFHLKYEAPYSIDFVKGRLSTKYGDAPYTRAFHVFSTIDSGDAIFG
jgi:hypothetical protein